MPIIIKQVFKMMLPFVLKWLIQKAESIFVEKGTGKDKKAYVIEEILDFLKKNGLDQLLDEQKLSELIDKIVDELFNKKS